MPTWRPRDGVLQRLHRQAKADRWGVSLESFARCLEDSARRAFVGESPDAGRLQRYFASLHLEDLALACACAEGVESAWDHFVREYRPILYRAADAIDPGGGAREAADSLYGELFGLHAEGGERQSHFRYFHGRSSLATWLRAVLSQRHVDRMRVLSRVEPLAELESVAATERVRVDEPDWERHVTLLQRALAAAVAVLAPRDRLRLGLYYAQSLTLAQIGKVLGEHEATVSRRLTRTRRTVRELVERELREREGLTDALIAECYAAVVENPGWIDAAELVGVDGERKESSRERSR